MTAVICTFAVNVNIVNDHVQGVTLILIIGIAQPELVYVAQEGKVAL
jgi:hypothetical protein